MILAQIQIIPRLEQPPLMSGDVRQMLDQGLPVALLSAEDIPIDEIPAQEWQIDTRLHRYRSYTVTVAARPNCNHGSAYLRNYRRPLPRHYQISCRRDWRGAEPSPNPGLLAYCINEGITAITIPMMVKDGVRHDFYRHLFVDVHGLPDQISFLRYHNDPGITLTEERQVVAQLRESVTGFPDPAFQETIKIAENDSWTPTS